MELFGIAIGILAGVLTYIAWRNGRWMKQSHRDTLALIRETRELIKEESRLTRELIEKMDQRFSDIGKLIIVDGERTRGLVRELKT